MLIVADGKTSMSSKAIKILFFADTHLGFDLPLRPRIQRRRRGDDFFANYHHILNYALVEKVDLIVHGGDFFFRSRVPPLIIEKAFAPLIEIAKQEIPIYLVPGNHERSKLPGHLWLAHPNIHVFDRPKTFYQDIHGISVALSGFPFKRQVRNHFRESMGLAGFQPAEADIHLLCLHQTFEGAQVGPADFTFRKGLDNIPGTFIPQGVTAVLCGHIHRSQTLTRTLDGAPLAAPVIYPGSIERTSFAERNEAKHFVLLEIEPSHPNPKPEVAFIPLPTRPMVRVEIPTNNCDRDGIERMIREKLMVLNPESVVKVQLLGPGAEELSEALSLSRLRNLAPRTMNVSFVYQRRDFFKNKSR